MQFVEKDASWLFSEEHKRWVLLNNFVLEKISEQCKEEEKQVLEQIKGKPGEEMIRIMAPQVNRRIKTMQGAAAELKLTGPYARGIEYVPGYDADSKELPYVLPSTWKEDFEAWRLGYDARMATFALEVANSDMGPQAAEFNKNFKTQLCRGSGGEYFEAEMDALEHNCWDRLGPEPKVSPPLVGRRRAPHIIRRANRNRLDPDVPDGFAELFDEKL